MPACLDAWRLSDFRILSLLLLLLIVLILWGLKVLLYQSTKKLVMLLTDVAKSTGRYVGGLFAWSFTN